VLRAKADLAAFWMVRRGFPAFDGSGAVGDPLDFAS